MTQVCSICSDQTLRDKAKTYYKKIPSLRDSREVYAIYVLQGEELAAQNQKTLLRAGEIAAVALRRLIPPDASDELRLDWYERICELRHGMLGDEFGGFYEGQLLIVCVEIVLLCAKLRRKQRMEEVLDELLYRIDRHILAVLDPGSVAVSSVVSDPFPKEYHPLESITLPLLEALLKAPELYEHHARISALTERYRSVFAV
jgi:hypothetical protein